MSAEQGKVLVVDDEPNARSALAELLRDEGFVVESAPDGRCALHMLESFDPDVVPNYVDLVVVVSVDLDLVDDLDGDGNGVRERKRCLALRRVAAGERQRLRSRTPLPSPSKSTSTSPTKSRSTFGRVGLVIERLSSDSQNGLISKDCLEEPASELLERRRVRSAACPGSRGAASQSVSPERARGARASARYPASMPQVPERAG